MNRVHAFLAAALFVVTLALFWPVVHHDFITLDDRGYILLNEHVRTGLTWSNIVWAFTSSYGANWHPLTWVSHMLDCQWFGLNPGGHHLTSTVLHSLNASLLFLFLVRVTRAAWRSFLVAALFALHPLHVESVAWVAERKDVLSGLFFITTLWMHAEYVNAERAVRARGAYVFYAFSVVLFAFGLMSKPMLVTLPFVLLLLDVWPLKRFERTRAILQRLLIEKLPFFALSAAASVVTFLVQRHEGAVATTATIPFVDRVQNAVVTCVIYVGNLFWPTHLAVYYPYPASWPWWQVLGSALVIIGISVFCLLALGRSVRVADALNEQSHLENRKPQIAYIPVGWFWFLGMLVPVIGLVQVGIQARADRYTYLPSIGLFVAVVWFVGDLFQRTQKETKITKTGGRLVWIGVVTAAILVGFGICTHQQLHYWRDSETVFRHALAVTGPNAVAHFNLGTALVQNGRLEEAEKEFTEAVRIKQDFVEAYSDLGLVLTMQGRHAEAIPCLEKATAMAPSMEQAHYLLAGALRATGKTAEAMAELYTVLQLKPEWTAALNDLAWMLATSADESLRNGAEAVGMAEKACGLSGYQQPMLIGTLAAAYAEAGRFKEAIATAQTAYDRALALDQKDVAAKNRQLMELYKAERAFHEEK